ncbi:uncharacterized protein LOC116112428 [Pistacia vera]|uniref:uncharacterized protein LOC116112428 n=1 Tax=Pistacia vera TaxID=55513 RepID=UPI0012635A1F|nr:uncharacterized protein LOC116112428 [Pistacia vera]
MGECEKGFTCNYMLLKPEEVKFFDLIRILIYSDIAKRDFVDSSKAREETFRRRWLMFISIVVQKFLLFFAKPLACTGSGIEFLVNLVSSNRNLGVLFLNMIKGKLVKPDRQSATFISFIGNLDKRVKLDSSIKHGDARYFATLCMMASKAAYENRAYIETTVKDHWKMDYLGFYDYWNDYQDKATTQAFMLHDKGIDHDTIIVSFRGTEPFDADAWCSDFDLSWYEINGVGNIHGGFMKALGLQKQRGWPKEMNKLEDMRPEPLAYYAIREMLKDQLSKNDRAKYILTGHSLGGALAILFPTILILHEEKLLLERLEGIYTYGQPRVGDEQFGKFMEMKLKEHSVRYFRLVYSNDMVPRLPYDDSDLMFKHFGTCIYYNRHYEAKVVPEQPNKNYFSPLNAIPMMINAFLELIRSFTIVYKMGPDYKEGWFLKVFRVIGLVMPGISAHSTQDYVNATRLGSSDGFLPSQLGEIP